MDNLSALRPKLSRLKLSGILETLDIRLSEAMEGKWDYTQFLLTLLCDEVERRDAKQLEIRLARSGMDPSKTLETFDFSFNPHIHQPTIRELAAGLFVRKRTNVFLVGPSGVGKSHLAQSFGLKACLQGIDVLYRNTNDVMDWLHAGRADGSYKRRLKQLSTVGMLILDDFGLLGLSELAQNDLYQIISARYERLPIIITSNRDFSEWPMVFDNPLMGSAAMDRLVHRAVKLVIEGKSYRMNSFKMTTETLTDSSTIG
jgi:DNA replication protein DnaC